MATASARLEVNDEGAVQTITVAGEKFEQLSQSTDKAADALSNYERVAEILRNTNKDLKGAIAAANSDIEDLDKRLGGINSVVQSTEATFAQLAAELPIRAEKEEFIDALNEINDDLRGGALSVDQLSNALVGLDQQFEDSSQKADRLQEAESRLEEGTEVTRQEIKNLTDALGLFEDTGRTIDPKLQKLDDLARESAKSFQELASAIDFTDVGNIFDQIDRLEQSLQDLDEEQEQAEQSAEQHTNAQQRQEAQAKQTANAQERYTNALRENRGIQNQTNEILFSTGDAIQDLQFGIRGAGNNIAFMAENFLQASQQAGSFSSVLKGVVSGLTGPVGIIVGIQTLLALGPQIASWFSSRNEEASELEESLKGAADSMLQFEEEIAGFTVQNLEQAEEARDRLQERVDLQKQQRENLKRILEFRTNEAVSAESMQGITAQELAILEQRLGVLGDSAEEVRKAIQAKKDEIAATKTAVKRAKDMVDSREAQKALEETLKDLGLDRAENTEEEADQVERIETGLVEVEEKLLDFESRTFDTGLVTDALLGDAEDPSNVEQLMEEGFISTFEQADAAISTLQSQLQGTDLENQERIDNIRALIKELQRLKDETKDTGNEIDSFSDGLDNLDKQQAISQAITDNFVALGKAIGQGENAVKAFGQAALGVLQQVGTAMGKQLIAQGSALIASSLIPGQQGNAAAGAKLVAAGGALVAASSALGSIIGGSGGQGTGSNNRSNDPREVEGGGSVDIEGRRRGGPVGAGGLYETHGLGNREFFVPNMNGAIMTQGQMRSSSSKPKRTVEVVTENRLQGNINGPDLFELETRLSEVANFKTEFGEG